MYCEHCNRLVYKPKCPGCGSRDLRLPASEDFCLLTEQEQLWTQAMRDILSDNGIDFRERDLYGMGQVKRTGIPQRVRFFVRYRDYEKAKELQEAFFSASFDFEME